MKNVKTSRQWETTVENQQKKRTFWTGVFQGIPIALGYIPISFAYGVLAQNNGLSIFNTVIMSIIVFAGSAQLIAVSLFASGASCLSIVMTTFIVNLRHLLMSAALTPHLKRWKKLELFLFSYHITDETFAINTTKFSECSNRKSESFGVNAIAQVSWVLGTILGVFTCHLIQDPKPFGLDYALAAMFIGLLVFMLQERSKFLVAILAGGLSVLFYLIGMNQWNVIIATSIAATLGAMGEIWIKK